MASVVALEKRVKELSVRFLDHQIPNEPSPTFAPDLDGIASFRLLVHAEFEEWLETLAAEELVSLQKQLASGVAIRNSHRLMLVAASFSVPCTFELPFDPQRFRTELMAALSAAQTFISDNNGIKAGSFCKLAMICGAPLDEIDPALTSALNDYGKSRGAVAHKSAQHVRSLLAPSAEKHAAETVVTLIRNFSYSLNPV